MDFEFICIYNPDLGTEEDVAPQIVHCSSQDVDAIKIIGIAQGVVELAYSFGERPAKWFKTGRASMSRHVIIVPLFSETRDDWRSGFWFAGQLPVHADCPAPEVSYRLVQLSFEQHLLTKGRPPSPSSNEDHKHYWSQFAAQRIKFSMPSIVTPDAIRLAPGSLNPVVKRQIEKFKEDFAAIDFLVTIAGDGAAVYPGGSSNLRTRIALQRWLMQNLNKKAPPRTEQEATESATQPEHEEAILQPSITKSSSSTDMNEAGDTNKTDKSAQHVERSGTWFSKVNFLPELSSFSVNLPSFPSLSLANMSLGSLSSTSVSDWWSANTEEETPCEGLIASKLEFLDLETGEPFRASIWRHGLYTYMSIYRVDVPEESSMFESLANQLEGFNFAFEPPTRFHYLIHDPFQSTVVSTFPINTASSNEIIRSMTEFPGPGQQVVRLGATWLYFVRMDHGARAVFGKKNVTTQQPTLLGALHKDVQQWLDEYARKYL